MKAAIIDGKAVAQKVRAECRQRAELLGAHGRRPGLTVIIVGDAPASRVYVRNKAKASDEAGIISDVIQLPADVSQAQLLEQIAQLNADVTVHGILVQLPLPKGLDSARVLQAISVEKDVDGFHPENVGRLVSGKARFVPCTPAGIMYLLGEYKVALWGSEAVVVGASNIVGKPIASLLLQQGATVTLCNSKTRDLAAHTRRADVLVVATGKAHMINGSMIKPGACVIDVGINRLDDGRLVGDVDFASAAEVASLITPVPGGVGPMTVAMLLANTIDAAERIGAFRT